MRKCICDTCGRVADDDQNPPVGWWALDAEFGTTEEHSEADTGIFCSSDCAKAWLDDWKT